jgi:hypothetical protein
MLRASQSPFDEARTWNRLWSNASVSGRTRFGTRSGDPKGLPSCIGLLRSARFSLLLLGRWPKRSESLLRANRLVARNPLRLELARQRDISCGRSAVSKGPMKPGSRRADAATRLLRRLLTFAAGRSLGRQSPSNPWRARSFWYAYATRTMAPRIQGSGPNRRG